MHSPILKICASISTALLLTTSNVFGEVLFVDQNHVFTPDKPSDGTSENPFRTIGEAVTRAEPGDTIHVMPGVYREHVAPMRSGREDAPIVFEAEPGHQVFVRGSEQWTPQWKSYGDAPGVFAAPLDAALFQDAVRNPYVTGISITSPGAAEDYRVRPLNALDPKVIKWQKEKQVGRLPRTLGQLFVDSQPYAESESLNEVLRMPGTWMVSENGDEILAHFRVQDLPIAEHEVELTVRDRIFAPSRRGLSYIIVRGFVFEHAANQGPFPQLGAVSLRSGSNWLVEDNIIRYAKTVGLDAGSETYAPDKLLATEDADKKTIYGSNNTIRNNVISDNGLCGLAAWHCYGIEIVGNTVERNNYLGFRPKIDLGNSWEEHGGIKLHGATQGLIQGNLVRENDAHGIWIDNGFTDARISRNVVLNNAGGGIVLELGNGPVMVDRNVVAFTRAYSGYYAGDGIYGHDASGITAVQNLCYDNARFGIFFQQITDRKVGGKPAEASDITLKNNMLIGNGIGAIKLPVPGKRSANNLSDFNVYDREDVQFFLTGNKAPIPLDKWRGFTGWDKNSVVAAPERLILRPQTVEVEVDFGDTKPLLMPALDAKRSSAGEEAGIGSVLAGPWPGLDSVNQRFFLLPPVR